MINSIPTIENNNKNAFSQVSNRNLPRNYWLGKDGLKGVYNIGDIEIPIMTPEEARKTNNIKLIGLSIAGATVLSAAGIFFLLKGGPKGLSKNILKFRNYMEKEIQKARLDNPDNPKINKIYLFAVKYADMHTSKFEAINNFTTLKDFAFKEFMFNKKTGSVTGKLHSRITRMFEKIGRQTVVNSYESTRAKMAQTFGFTKLAERRLLKGDLTQKIEINGETRTLKEWIQKLADMNQDVSEGYLQHFNPDTLTSRYLNIKQAASVMCDKFAQKGHFWFWSPDTLNKFVAESAIADSKKALQASVKGFRREISYSIDDLIKDSDDLILKMTNDIPFNEVDKIAKFRSISLKIKELSKLKGKNEIEALRADIFKEMESLTGDILKSQKEKTIEGKVVQNLLEGMLELRTGVKEFRPGKVEEILSVYKKLLPEKEYKALEKSYKASIKSLDKSINIETEDFMSKVRDLSMGSAPTDILTVLGSFITLGYYLVTTGNKRDRESVLLKYGIPALAGIGTSLFCNARLFAGTKGLAFATASTLIVGKLGAMADNLLKKHYDKNLEK